MRNYKIRIMNLNFINKILFNYGKMNYLNNLIKFKMIFNLNCKSIILMKMTLDNLLIKLLI